MKATIKDFIKCPGRRLPSFIGSVKRDDLTLLVTSAARIPQIRAAFEAQRTSLAETSGNRAKPRSPNVMVVATDDPKSQHGKQGLGVLAVRYYDPR